MTVTGPAPSLTPDVERLLTSLAGIHSVSVVQGNNGRLLEIHVLASASLHAKQVVRNVESALRAGLGVEVDRRIVSVAQVDADEAESGDGREPPATTPAESSGSSPRPATGPQLGTRRLEFVRYRSRRRGDGCTCEVVLREAGREVLGAGDGPSSAGGRAEAGVRAVLEAIRQARPHLALELGEATVVTVRDRDFVIAAVHLLRGRALARVAGAAAIVRGVEEAAILATLQATNRWTE